MILNAVDEHDGQVPTAKGGNYSENHNDLRTQYFYFIAF